VRSRTGRWALWLTVVALMVLAARTVQSYHRRPIGSPKLVSIEEVTGDTCTGSDSDEDSKVAQTSPRGDWLNALDERPVYAADSQASTVTLTRPPVRDILDTAPIYTSVAVDPKSNEAFLQDSNTWSIRVFGRLDNVLPSDPPDSPRRVIVGPKTEIEFDSDVFVDPPTGEVYSVENDIGNDIVVFDHDANGDVKPIRKLYVTHRAYAMDIDQAKDDLYVSVEYPPQVQVYRKEAAGHEQPRRLIKGPKTLLSDDHGLVIDTKRNLLFVDNWGRSSDFDVPGTGHFDIPSITVYPLDADGDTAPLRVIKGLKTQMNWPAGMALDPDTGELYVANDMGQSIIVFHETDEGDVSPFRVIKGEDTGLQFPTGVFVDKQNKELWATNLGNSSATVYPLSANGDVAPVRLIRSAAADKKSLRFGKTQAVAYDSKREQILVPN
jgi:DNA-binding beta-propeller fold protein YncE